MPTWSGILHELQNTRTPSGQPDFDGVRRKYLAGLCAQTGRSVILYAAKWTQGATNTDPDTISINDEDLQGLMEVIHGLPDAPLDLIVHSPGGSAEATEMVVHYLRSKFTHIRVIVPQAAMSAATMLACAADEIIMGKHSALGPIDPQFIIGGPFGRGAVPAQAILDQFDLAREECRDPAKLAAWLPMLSQVWSRTAQAVRERVGSFGGPRHGMVGEVDVQERAGRGGACEEYCEPAPRPRQLQEPRPPHHSGQGRGDGLEDRAA
jgi:hypothetical protein